MSNQLGVPACPHHCLYDPSCSYCTVMYRNALQQHQNAAQMQSLQSIRSQFIGSAPSLCAPEIAARSIGGPADLLTRKQKLLLLE